MKGLATSPGIGIGKVFIYKEAELKIEKTKIKNIDAEMSRLELALNKAAAEINNLYKITLDTVGEKEAQIFTAHKMILSVPEFLSAVKKRLKDEKIDI